MNVRTVARTAAAMALATMVTTGFAAAQEMTLFRIATGGTAGTYFPIGGLIANAISSPPGSRPCEEGGSCGVPGLVATAVASNGSVANINSIGGGTIESGFSQSDVAYWAYTGTGVFAEHGKVESVRAIANLYPESIHIVARADSGIESVADLKGRKVSLDEPGSGTLVTARIILEAHGLAEEDIDAEYLKSNQAANRMRDNNMDAFFFVGGFPAEAISELATSLDISLVPIDGERRHAILEDHRFFAQNTVPGGTYRGLHEDVETISVGAQWVTSSDQPEDLVYGITKALWNDNTRKLLDSGHAKGKEIVVDNALEGISIPLHPGAERFYKEIGFIR